MNIAILSFYSGINQRGVERWVFDISERLTKDHNVTVFQNSPLNKKCSYNIVTAGISYKSNRQPHNQLLKHLFIDYQSFKILQFNIKIIIKLINSKFDVVIPTDGGWEPAIIRIITWLKGKKMVIVGHAGIGWDDVNNLWSFPDVFVALSTVAKNWAGKINPFVKSVYIPDAVDTKIFRNNGERIKLNLKKPVALCVSALEEGKRIDLIIKAAAKVKGLSLLICGRGECKKDLEKLGNEIMPEKFDISHFDFEKMPEVYRAADVFLSASLPSYSFEMVLPEAMACGLPVVANNDPIRKEIIGEAGILTDVNDADEFSKAIGLALKKYWNGIPEKQAHKYSWDNIITNYQNLITDIVNE